MTKSTAIQRCVKRSNYDVGAQVSAIANRQQIGALAGVAPFDKQSGKSDRKRTTRGGRTGTRTSGYMGGAFCAALQPIIKAFAAQLKADGQTLQRHQRSRAFESCLRS